MERVQTPKRRVYGNIGGTPPSLVSAIDTIDTTSSNPLGFEKLGPENCPRGGVLSYHPIYGGP